MEFTDMPKIHVIDDNMDNILILRALLPKSFPYFEFLHLLKNSS